MFRRKLVPVWIGIVILSGMFLMGQQELSPNIEGAWQGTALEGSITAMGVIGVTAIIACSGTWSSCSVSGTVMGEPFQSASYDPTTRKLIGSALTPDHEWTISFDCTMFEDTNRMDCTYTATNGASGTLLMTRVNSLPENPDPHIPYFDYSTAYPLPGETGVPREPILEIPWSKAMAFQWDVEIIGCGGEDWDGSYFEEVGYHELTNGFVIQLKDGYLLTPFCDYTLYVITCEDIDGFRDAFGVTGECPGPVIPFTTGAS